MNAERVTIGSESKGDCLITVAPAASLAIEVEAGNAALVEQGIRVVASETAAAVGVTAARITVTDRGALDYVLRARVETALRSAFPEVASPDSSTG